MVLFLPIQFVLYLILNLTNASIDNEAKECTQIRRMDTRKCSSPFYGKTSKKCSNNHTRSDISDTDTKATVSHGYVYPNITEARKRCFKHKSFAYKLFGGQFGICVKYFFKKLSWPEARSKCTFNKARLVQIDTAEKNHAYAVIANAFGLFWLGGSDRHKEGTWTWTDGTSVPGPGTPGLYRNWARNEPDGGTGQNCMVFYRYSIASPWEWISAGCDDRKTFICEKTV